MKQANRQTSVTDAEQTLARLERERHALLDSRAAQEDERRAIAFAAHDGDSKAAKRLAELHTEAACFQSRVSGLDDAIVEARRRLEAARAEEAKAVDREHAQQLGEALSLFVATAGDLDGALADVAALGHRLHDLQKWMRELGAATPNEAQLDALGYRCLLTACAATPWFRHFETLAPHERRSFAQLVAIWANMIEKNHIRPRLGDGEQQTTVAA